MSIFIFLLFFIALIGLPFFIYVNAQKRGLKPTGWVILSYIFPFLGALIYAVVARKHPKAHPFSKVPYGFRSRKRWKMMIATFTYGLITAFTVMVAYGSTQPTPPPVTPSPDTQAEVHIPSKAVSTKPVVDTNVRTNPLAGVYHPYRLEVKDAYKTVTGTVDKVRHEKDGDYHINLKLDSKYVFLINAKNTQYEQGDLVVEVIPMDQPNIPTPTVGEHLSVSGAYVLDKDHGWMEIHPAWIINGHGTAKYTAVAAAKSAGSPTDDETTPTTVAKPAPPSATVPPAQKADSTNKATVDTTPAPNPKPAPTPAPTPQPTVQIVSVTSPAARNSEATLVAKVAPGATASIEVDYKSGPSQAQGLEDKTADSNGNVSWTWHVGGRTTIGTWPITVTSGGVSAQTQFEVVH